MQKVDIVIALVGAFALITTGLGVAFYDDLNNIQDYDVVEVTTPISESGAVPAAGLDFDITVPDNAVHAMLSVVISFASQNPAAACTVTGSVSVTTPDGEVTTEDGSWEFGAGSGTIEVAPAKWAEAPETFRGTSDQAEEATLVWDEPLTVAITVEDTGCGAPLIGAGGATYNAEVTGDFHGFRLSTETPDPQAA